MERNEKGELLMHLLDAMTQAGLRTARYNGGWVKKITGLDKSRVNGYSLLGEFVQADRMAWVPPGLYLNCDVGGSRKRHVKVYDLFRVNADGTITQIANVGNTLDWAVRLWPAVEEALATPATSNRAAIEAEITKLEAQLTELRRKLESLT